MQPLQTRPVDPLLQHKTLPVRNYAEDPVQCDRIRRTREAVGRAILDGKDEVKDDLLVISLGCGSGDVEGPFSAITRVIGFDCNPAALACARERFPLAFYFEADIEALEPRLSDVLILSEVLEHLQDPHALVARWLPQSRHVVITHPINEPLDSTASGGDHSWSYDEWDLKQWLVNGEHQLEEFFVYQMGIYVIGCVRGKLALDSASNSGLALASG